MNAGVQRLMVWLFLFFGCAGALPANAAQPETPPDLTNLTTVLPTQTIRVAQPFELQLQVISTDPAMVELADNGAEVAGEFDIVGMRSLGPSLIAVGQEDLGNRFQTTLILTLEIARAGQRKLPKLQVQVTIGQEVSMLVSDVGTIDVEGIVPDDFDPTEFRELKPIAQMGAADDPSRVAWMVLATLIGLMGVLFFLWRRSRTSDAVIRQRWIAEIDLLENGVRNRAMDLTEAHDESCHLIRRWIESLVGFPATSLPTDQLVNELGSRSWPQSVLDRLSNTLSRNDQLKFSADAMPPERASNVFDDARWIISHPTPAIPSEANS